MITTTNKPDSWRDAVARCIVELLSLTDDAEAFAVAGKLLAMLKPATEAEPATATEAKLRRPAARLSEGAYRRGMNRLCGGFSPAQYATSFERLTGRKPASTIE